jgi:methionyl-tRNA synthetase
MADFFLTTAIDYANGRPHLGHAYEKVLCDAMARFQRNQGKTVLFLTGTDEHGQKVQQSAAKAGIAPQQFCDEISSEFQALWDRLNISYSTFGRTTNPLHKDFTRQCLQQLFDQGEIYFQEHEGYYSVRQEQFVTDKDQVDGKWPEIYGEVVLTKEPNYFFKLSKYQGWLLDFLKSHPDWIQPAFRQNEVLGALEKPLDDLCISRPKSRLEWGIPLPFDENFVTYVWFDALLNYVSFAQADWPADFNVIGKDILVPAHGVYWPIMLKALNLPTPKHLAVHGWWLNRGAKMSKSQGNSVDPVPYLERYTADGFRYFLLRDMTFGQDADFTDEKVQQRYDADLAKDFGNLVNRALSMLVRYRNGVVPSFDAATVTELESDLRSDALLETYAKQFESWQIHAALQTVWTLVGRCNQYVEQTAPWKLAKDPEQAARLDLVLAHLVESVRRLAILVEPVIPTVARKVMTQLGLGEPGFLLKDATFGAGLAGRAIGTPEPLFPRIEEAKE